ncbi:hypothetical protein F6W69_10695 [Microbacterium oxydans]|uniref:hypothetical protein n=1 Tax=Microbacterium oxydans TaxID=82380 RepID=UPI001144189F|nr:hypothetical protein [Microbacterium oxydans]KAB1891056.1 hypothetical protein F6W69_10695 [Microbacterium oxydans]GED39082.1 hypothetical protein MOX01_22240 [Microbacterium oxydans]
MDEWEAWIHEAITGAPVERVFPEAFPWSTSLLGDGKATTTFKVDDVQKRLTRDRIWSLFVPNARMLVLRRGSFVAYAGKIDDWDYDRDSQVLMVASVELENEWSWRLTYGVSGYTDGTLTVVNRTHSGAVRAILARATQRSVEWNYPIDLPSDAAGTFSAQWDFFKKFKISDLLDQIRAEGYEIYLRPYIDANGNVRFQARVEQKILIGASTFILQAAESPLSGVNYKLDGSRQLTGLQGVGNGTGQDQEVAWAGSGPYTIPIRDAKRDFPDLAGPRLQAATNQTLADERVPLVQWSVGQFTISEKWSAEQAAVGRAWQIDSTGDNVIPDGTHALRVIALSGDLSDTMKVEVQSAS